MAGRIEVFSSSFATIALPAYIGWVHAGLLIFILYGLVGGVAVAVGDRLTIPWLDGANGRDFASYAGLCVINMILAGGLVYVLALFFI